MSGSAPAQPQVIYAIGGRIPVVMGTSIALVGAAIGIGSEHGLPVVFGACLVAAVVEVILGFSIVRVRNRKRLPEASRGLAHVSGCQSDDTSGIV